MNAIAFTHLGAPEDHDPRLLALARLGALLDEEGPRLERVLGEDEGARAERRCVGYTYDEDGDQAPDLRECPVRTERGEALERLGRLLEGFLAARDAALDRLAASLPRRRDVGQLKMLSPMKPG